MQSIKTKIKQSFSKAAVTYDKYAVVQNLIGSMMLEDFTFSGKIQHIMEIGSGTGNFTEKLLIKLQNRKIHLVLVDFSSEMLAQSMEKLEKKYPDVAFSFIAEDAENIGFAYNRKFDAIVSNSTFQWFVNFQETLLYYASLLNTKGYILFSIFGRETFSELSDVLRLVFAREGIVIPSSRFLDIENIRNFLAPVFENIRIHEHKIKESYSSLMELLRTIRYTGEYGMGVGSQLFLTPGKIKEMEKLYIEKYGQIEATYHFYICSGERK